MIQLCNWALLPQLLRTRPLISNALKRRPSPGGLPLRTSKHAHFNGPSVHTRRAHSSIARSCENHELVQRYGPLADHPDLDLAKLLSSTHVIKDCISDAQEQLLDASLQHYLPSAPHLRSLQPLLPIGHQQVHFRPSLSRSDLLPDGTDTRFLPGPASIWQYRLWAGGSVSLLPGENHSSETALYQREVVEDVRITGTLRPERVFVTVRKEISSFSYDQGLPPTVSVESLSNPTVERYTLCFLREPPGTAGKAKTIKPPSGATFAHTIKPDGNLLFQFSALTHNAHKIHLDPSYAQQEYKLKAPVVHGPLMMVLMLDFMRKYFDAAGAFQDGIHFQCEHMDYRNFAPLYVNEELTMCCKPAKAELNQQLHIANDWQVWIQTGSGDDAALAVRGTVKAELVRLS